MSETIKKIGIPTLAVASALGLAAVAISCSVQPSLR
jgi:hypothetical protein